jgi:prepilin signal peptidase PulO-like enzyme (type II secretory pathway)
VPERDQVRTLAAIGFVADTPGPADSPRDFISLSVTNGMINLRTVVQEDVKAVASIGTLLAWQSWRLLITGGFAGFLFAAIYGITLLASGRATRKQHIPFGPFMLAGAFAVILAWHL